MNNCLISFIQAFIAMNKKRPFSFMFKKQHLSTFPLKYTLENIIIGEGAYAKVKRATLKTNNEVRAVKMIDRLTLDRSER